MDNDVLDTKINQRLDEFTKKELLEIIRQEIIAFHNRANIKCECCLNFHNQYEYCKIREELKKEQEKQDFEQAVLDGYSFYGTS